ncbi:alpha-hydroxy-acid oxidizing protein [Desulfobacula phenolica]|uniref:FMN-dependent dehydrogenase, includes L-lactate dehydrogenase and type II isopentenyl diphosphate isomerase n=1 Tax=Desulfobacula phenolica TaxID=90732 RepID=A0A1H2GJ73_9BACT|nr:alpha-hydroxy-acid oxidizing protein [Desulfobacula phenolica]SDU19667.1 FMN-dependent dehydrogenase, includes L-lactate dehydrogenase and type II isopentenyl diphosphate isomerase [Desulfobacula phenolica]
MNQWYCSVCHEMFDYEDKPVICEICDADHRMIFNIKEVPQSLEQVRDLARKKLKGICAGYPSCDGSFDKICQREAYGKPIGLGGIGLGRSFRGNSEALEKIQLNMSVLGEHFEPDTTCSFLDVDLEFPVLASSTAGAQKYNDAMDETQFCTSVLRGSKEAGTIGLRGDTWFYTLDDNPSLNAMKACEGYGIPIFKPRSQDVLKNLIEKAEDFGCKAFGIDLDGCGSSIMALHGQPVFKKSVKDIEELVSFTNLPFIAKGIMIPDEALMCADAGASVVAVSNHGGRVLDSTPGVATMLPLIREKVGDLVTITADGGVRTGYDVLKMLALGADAVLLGRDIIRAAVGAGTLGVKMHLEHIKKTLKKAMFMTGMKNIKMIDSKILFDYNQNKEEQWEKY